MKKYWLLLAVIMIVSSFVASAGIKDNTKDGNIPIVQNGMPVAVIVIPLEAKEKFPKAIESANAIQKYIQKMTDAELPIIMENQQHPANISTFIYVGHTQAAKKNRIRVPSGFNPAIRPDVYEEEGYIIKTIGNNIFIAGNEDGPYQGTIYAAYMFLEKLGCRWYFPGQWGEVIPQTKTITAQRIDIEAKPDFAMRGIWIDGRWGMTAENRKIYADWAKKVGFSSDYTGGQKLYPTPGDGYLAQPLPPKEYAESHPEYYAMDKTGKRNISPTTHPSFAMLCLSNQEMQKEYIKNVKEAFEGKKKYPNISEIGIGISPPDGTPYCYCETCLAQSQNFNYPTYVHERMQSEEVFSFACKIADTFPDKWVAVSAYALREMPPQGVKLRPNMVVMYAPISCCVLHPNNATDCWRRIEMMHILKQWIKLTPHVWLYDYTPGLLVSGFIPERDVANFAINAPIYKQIGLKGFGRQGSNAMMSTWISYYTSAKLMWDVNTDVEAVKKDFYSKFFGSQAGPYIQAWWDSCEEQLLKAKLHVHEDWLINNVYTLDFANSIHRFYESAKKCSMTEEEKQHFRIFELIVENFEAWTQMHNAEMLLDYKKAKKSATKMIETQEKLYEISEFLIGKGGFTNQWECYTKGREIRLSKLEQMTNGESGIMIAQVPITAKFTRDRFNEGVIAQWYLPEFEDTKWGTENTFYLWDQQDKPEDAVGHDYDGYGWYRFWVDIPSKWKNKPTHFYCGGVINEGWVWVNGEYAGHKPHSIWWMGEHDFDLDITKLVRYGEKNLITIRVWNNSELGGLYRRGFIWSPNKQ
ncbi:MAG: Glycosyl hydrolases family 2, sugar binding domain [candidate division TA06 bacterium ADurb.Bin131]|uniref:Glycosyl hydrolases family 2, sugar binding domain n=1 Tax=candidate division TA06 bacterium ADurb.Bin131 TaxID=1852827 RepID=A0A1V6C525_UNCT6|nr:MAG: Glycosyl hydrolases family 2, sugar binding domain [candidate division TA06 bacterium ADurb.Bin131]